MSFCFQSVAPVELVERAQRICLGLRRVYILREVMTLVFYWTTIIFYMYFTTENVLHSASHRFLQNPHQIPVHIAHLLCLKRANILTKQTGFKILQGRIVYILMDSAI